LYKRYEEKASKLSRTLFSSVNKVKLIDILKYNNKVNMKEVTEKYEENGTLEACEEGCEL